MWCVLLLPNIALKPYFVICYYINLDTLNLRIYFRTFLQHFGCNGLLVLVSTLLAVMYYWFLYQPCWL